LGIVEVDIAAHRPVRLVFTAGSSITCRVTDPVVVIAGAVPVTPPPAHDTFHVTVACNANVPGLL